MKGSKYISLSSMELFHTILALDNNLAYDHLASCHDVHTKSSLKRSLKKMIAEYIGRGSPYGRLELDSEEGFEYYIKLLRSNS